MKYVVISGNFFGFDFQIASILVFGMFRLMSCPKLPYWTVIRFLHLTPDLCISR